MPETTSPLSAKAIAAALTALHQRGDAGPAAGGPPLITRVSASALRKPMPTVVTDAVRRAEAAKAGSPVKPVIVPRNLAQLVGRNLPDVPVPRPPR